MIKTLNRYIFLELIDPFIFGLGSFTAIMSASMILFELVRAVVLNGMPLITALLLFIFKLPNVMVYIFPMATLLATLLAFSRLSHDSEIIAFRASGISLNRIILPVLIFGLMVSLITLLFYEVVVPEANKAAKNLLIETSTKHAPKMQENVFMPEIDKGELKRIFYAREIKGDTMQGVIVQEFSNGQLNQIINAQNAKWIAGENRWLFSQGLVYLLSESGEYKHLIKFKEQSVAIKYTPADFFTQDKKPEEMNISQLKRFINMKEKMGENTTDLKIQLNMKTAIPFASLVFALLGAPLGISPRRASSSIGLGLSIIVVFIYYIVMFTSMAIGELKILSPFIAAWMPNFITAGLGVYILNQKNNN